MRTHDLKDKITVKFAGMHNCFLSSSKHHHSFAQSMAGFRADPSTMPTIDSPLQQLVRDLAKFAPSYEYYFVYSFSRTRSINEMFITHQGETLGWVRTSGNEYGYNTPSLDKERVRGAYSVTANYTKLLTVLKKQMRPSNIAARLDRLTATGRDIITATINTEARTYRSDKSTLMGTVEEKILENWDAIVGLGILSPVEVELGQLLYDGKAEYIKEQATLSNLPASLTSVIIEGHQFTMRRAGDAVPVTLQRDEVHEDIRAAIGILKLSERDEYIRDYGVRHDDNFFTIMYDGVLTNDGS